MCMVSLMEKMLAYIITGLLYIILLMVVAYCVFKNSKVKIELWNNGLVKKNLLIVLFILYIIAFFSRISIWMDRTSLVYYFNRLDSTGI